MREPSSVGFEGNGVVSPPPQALLERLKDYGQEDVFALWDELSPEERDYLVKDIEVISLRFTFTLDSITNSRFAIQSYLVFHLRIILISEERGFGFSFCSISLFRFTEYRSLEN